MNPNEQNPTPATGAGESATPETLDFPSLTLRELMMRTQIGDEQYVDKRDVRKFERRFNELQAERNAATLRAEAAEREVAQTNLNWRREIEAVNSLAHLVENQDRELKSAQADLAKAREELAELTERSARARDNQQAAFDQAIMERNDVREEAAGLRAALKQIEIAGANSDKEWALEQMALIATRVLDGERIYAAKNGGAAT